MKNLFILPSKKPSRLLKSQNNNFMIIKSDTTNWFEIILKNTYQNIYITNNDGLNENDYVITDDVDNYGKLFQVSWLKNNKIKNCYKVILTTDQDLIKDGVQSIDDDFLEWFVKNPSCEEVEVECYSKFNDGDFTDYKIIIPKEEPKQICEYCKIEITKYGCGCGTKEPKQERKYSEEDLKQFAFECVGNFLSNRENELEIELVNVISDRNNKLFEKFKNK